MGNALEKGMTPSFVAIELPRVPEGTLAEERPIALPHGAENLTGSMATVPRADGVVLIANDSGCGRQSAALRRLAAAVRRQGFTTVLVDLLLPAEVGIPEHAAGVKLQVEELARRIGSARQWIAARPELAGLPVMLLGHGAGASAVALSARARPLDLAAVLAMPGSILSDHGAIAAAHAVRARVAQKAGAPRGVVPERARLLAGIPG